MDSGEVDSCFNTGFYECCESFMLQTLDLQYQHLNSKPRVIRNCKCTGLCMLLIYTFNYYLFRSQLDAWLDGFWANIFLFFFHRSHFLLFSFPSDLFFCYKQRPLLFASLLSLINTCVSLTFSVLFY